jgi:hypothetical protein
MTHLDLKLRQEQELQLLIDLHCYFKAYFKDADLTAAELGSNSGAALHRKYRKGEKFMDEELQTGSIDEINKIFRNKTKADVDFFETDIGAVMDFCLTTDLFVTFVRLCFAKAYLPRPERGHEVLHRWYAPPIASIPALKAAPRKLGPQS